MPTEIFMEELSRRIFTIVRAQLADALDRANEQMQASDEEFFAALGEPVPATELVPPVTWMVGQHPPVLEQPPETFPSVAVACYRRPDDSDQGADQWEILPHAAYVEAICISRDEGEVQRMAQRYGKALNRVFTDNKTLGGMVERITRPPDVLVSLMEHTEPHNDDPEGWYVQGVRLEQTFEIIQVWD